jgi:LacI family transcriptional regulator
MQTPANDFEAPLRRSTIRDVAAEAGVSTATVSRVLNDSAGVAPETRALVLHAIEQHSFTGRRKRRRAPLVKGVVAVRCPYVLTDYFGLIISGVARSLRLHGKRLLFSDEYHDGTEPSLPDLLVADMTEGAILVLPPEPPSVLGDLRASGYPFVVVDPRVALPGGVAAVSAAHMAGARAATEHLIQLGHNRIATITGQINWLSADGRLMGYRGALAATGRLAPEEFVRVGGEPNVENGLEAARALLDLPQPPSAIVAYNDKMALGVLQAAAERGLRVPRDLSVVGFDGLELSQSVVPRLTTVRQPLEEMARMAVELLVRLIDGRDIHTLHVELATELVPGESTGPPR